jgi:hypothetical protein
MAEKQRDSTEKPTFSKFDVILFSASSLLFIAGGIVALWMDHYWLLKCWFTYKVVQWWLNFVVYELIKDSTFSSGKSISIE